MDQPDLAPERHTHALASLARINFFSGSSGILFPPLAEFQRKRNLSRLLILDVASGAGDLPIRLWQRARRAGLDWHIAGCDISPVAVSAAHDLALRERAPVEFFVHDVIEQALTGSYDAITCSLFLHHLEEGHAVKLLAAMAGASSMVLVNDLDRSFLGLILAHLVPRLLTTSDVVHIDGPLSVKAAFTPREVLALAKRAGLHGARVSRRWPCRWLLKWIAPPESMT
jgi:2-polyprenyl-3-methyl-5-hydroxy-6-metoxy-1,4-benzoquinol methylase